MPPSRALKQPHIPIPAILPLPIRSHAANDPRYSAPLVMAVTRALPAAALLAVALLLGGTAAIKQAPFTLDDLGTGVAGPANCSASSSGTMPTTWAEITEVRWMDRWGMERSGAPPVLADGGPHLNC